MQLSRNVGTFIVPAHAPFLIEDCTMRSPGRKVLLTLLVVAVSTSVCTRQDIDLQNERERISHPPPPFTVSISNDTVLMNYVWDRDVSDYSIGINPYIEDGVIELGPEIPDLPPLQHGDTLTLTQRDIGNAAWEAGFQIVFYPDDADMPLYGWKYRDGAISEFIVER
jgi:hypothetical protein